MPNFDLPDYVRVKVAKGRTYYYFAMCREGDPGQLDHIRLPDISDPTFKAEVAALTLRRPVSIKRGRWNESKRAQREPYAPKVYFIGGDDGLIKIGFAERPKERLRQLQTGSPIPLRILALVDGDHETERAYHARFSAFRVMGEWFERHPELLAEITQLESGTNGGCENLVKTASENGSSVGH